MKRIFIQMLPVMAAILLATSCSKDDGGNSVIDNVVAPQEEPIQEVVETSIRKTITITGKVRQASLSKVGVDGKKLTFDGTEVFNFSNGKEGDEAISGTIKIKSSEGDYEASFPLNDALTSSSFTATLNEHKPGVVDAGEKLADAVKAACYAIDFTVLKNDDGVYKMKSGDASDIVVNIESAFIHPTANGWITVSGRSYYVYANKYYVVSNKSKMGAKGEITAGKIYNVSSPASEKTVPDGYVDLGIIVGEKKVFWAEKNVGAKEAWDSGDYYAWGEIEPYYSNLNPLTWKDGKSNGYAWASYQFSSDGTTFTKYTGSDDKSVLESEDDAATKTFDKASSMPTQAEWKALARTSNCTWVWTSEYNGNKNAGYIVYAGTGEHTLFDAHIFLPFAGFRKDCELQLEGNAGFYWSSSLSFSNNCADCAYGLCISNGTAVRTDDNEPRCYGLSVRAIRRK